MWAVEDAASVTFATRRADVVVEVDNAFAVRSAMTCVVDDAASITFPVCRADVAVEVDDAFAARLAAACVVDDAASIMFAARPAAACAFASR